MDSNMMDLDELEMVNGGERSTEKEVAISAGSVTICVTYCGGAGMLAGGPVGAAIGATAGASIGGFIYGVCYLLTDD